MEKYSIIEIQKALEIEGIDTSKIDLITSLQSAKSLIKSDEKLNGKCRCFQRFGTDITITEQCPIHYQIFV